VVCRRDLNKPEESIEHWSGVGEFHVDGTHTDKARDAKLEVTADLKNW